MERPLPSSAKLANPKIWLLCLLAWPLFLPAQVNPLNRKVSVRIQEEALTEALLELAEAGKFSFAYNSAILPADSVVSLRLRKETVRWGLGELFGEQMEFQAVGNHVVLRLAAKKMPDQPEFVSVTGYLIDGESGEKIPYATVYEAEKHGSVLTDREGKYTLEVPGQAGSVPLSFSRFGYRDTVVVIRPTINQQLTVGLTPLPRDPMTPQVVSLVGDQFVEDLPLADFFVPEPQRRRAFNIEMALARFPIQLSLVPSIGTNGSMSGGMTNHFSLNLLAGYSQGLVGLEIGGIANLVREDVIGVQVGGIANNVGGKVKGIQVGGIANHVGGSVHGLQLGGIYNLVRDTVTGVQISGIANLCEHHVQGLQIAGITNVAPESVDGLQIAGMYNVSRGKVRTGQVAGLVNKGKDIGGLQIAGLSNHSDGSVGGGQIAGLSNIATDSVDGFQIAGLFNKASHIQGGQIGLINIADTLDGIAIGLINWSRNGYQSLSVGPTDVNDIELGLRTGNEKLYFLVSVGARLLDRRNAAWSYGGGIGHRQRFSGRFALDAEYTIQQVNEERLGPARFNMVQALRPSLVFQPAEWLEITGGPALSYGIANGYGVNGEWISDLGRNAFLVSDGFRTRHSLWIGYQAALRIRL